LMRLRLVRDSNLRPENMSIETVVGTFISDIDVFDSLQGKNIRNLELKEIFQILKVSIIRCACWFLVIGTKFKNLLKSKN
jgi:hypothetical protein